MLESFEQSKKNTEGRLVPLLLLLRFFVRRGTKFGRDTLSGSPPCDRFCAKMRQKSSVFVFVAPNKTHGENNFFIHHNRTRKRNTNVLAHRYQHSSLARFYGEADDVVQKRRVASRRQRQSRRVRQEFRHRVPVHLVGELCGLRRRSRSGG